MTRKEQREKRRQEILVAALDVFIRKGYAAAKIQDIAEAVGMSVGLLFHYFESKEKLYEELIKFGKSGPEIIFSEIKEEPLKFFQTTAKLILQNLKEEPFVAKMFILMKQANCNDAIPESVKKLLTEVNSISLSAKIIKKGQKNGTIRKGNPEALAFAFWGAMQGIAEQIALLPESPIPDSEWIVDILRNKDK